MTADEYRAELHKLIRKAPRPEKIATVDSALAFKEIAKKAQKVSNKGAAQLQQIFNQLRNYY